MTSTWTTSLSCQSRSTRTPGTRENRRRVSIATAAFLQWGQGLEPQPIAVAAASKAPKSHFNGEGDAARRVREHCLPYEHRGHRDGTGGRSRSEDARVRHALVQ